MASATGIVRCAGDRHGLDRVRFLDATGRRNQRWASGCCGAFWADTGHDREADLGVGRDSQSKRK
jgi:hypothetical protein